MASTKIWLDLIGDNIHSSQGPRLNPGVSRFGGLDVRDGPFCLRRTRKRHHGMRGFNVTYPYNGHRGLVAAGLAGFGCRSSTYGVVWRYG